MTRNKQTHKKKGPNQITNNLQTLGKNKGSLDKLEKKDIDLTRNHERKVLTKIKVTHNKTLHQIRKKLTTVTYANKS